MHFLFYTGRFSHPDFVAGTAGWAVAHPTAIAFVAIGVLALQLSPFIIIALLLTVIFNISNVVPDELNPLFPKDVKENIREVKKDARIAREALAPVERSFSELENFKNEVQTQKQQARKRASPARNVESERKRSAREAVETRAVEESRRRRVGEATERGGKGGPTRRRRRSVRVVADAREKARCVDKNHRVSW